MNATDRIASFIAETDYDVVPPKAVMAAKIGMMDCLGVTVAGCNEPAPKILIEQAKRWAAREEATAIGTSLRTTAELAAWINGTASHALDYDDTSASADGYNMHPSVPVFPAVFAVGESRGSSGKEILAAYVVGIEVESRIGAAIGSFASANGWHPTPVLGTVGAAAACANLLHLSREQARMALGIAASHAGGFVKNFGTTTKPFHAGMAARNGVAAALLAEQGFTANPDALEGETGYCSLFSGRQATTLSPYDQDLGSSWHLVSPGISLKAYPCCRATHSSIDAAIQLRNLDGVRACEVARIVCRTNPHHTRLARFHRPETGYQAKFSIPYCIAVALLRGTVVLDDFSEEKLAQPEAQALLSQVTFEHPEEAPRLTQEVVVTLRDGRSYARKVNRPKGDTDNPMTIEEVSLKFRDCLRTSLAMAKAEEIINQFGRLEVLSDLSQLSGALGSQPGIPV